MLVLLAVLALALLEALCQLGVRFVLRQDRLLQADALLGWRPLADLDAQRRNADGVLWTVRTNAAGFRTAQDFGPAPACRLLVLGDSFAFGEGVEESQRFDALLLRSGSTACAIVNQGVPGYGTDQELLAAADMLPRLGPGDTLLLLTYCNDFVDILRHRFAGRPKPWYEATPQGQLLLHPAGMSLLDRLRDHSYLWARVAALREPARAAALRDPATLQRATGLYAAIVSAHLRPLLGRGVRAVIAYHGLREVRAAQAQEALRGAIEGLCGRERLVCVDLEAVLDRPRRPENFLADGHWSAQGHAVVAAALAAGLRPPDARP